MSKKINGFTLLELMIVIVLISIIYGIFINKISKDEYKSQIGLKSLREYLSTLEFKKKAEIICLEPCEECQIYIDNSPTNSFKLFNSTPEVFKFDEFGNLQKVDFGKDKNLKNICFKFQLFNNRSSSSFILKSDNKYYVYYPILQKTQIANSLDKAKELFDKSKLITPQFNY